MVLIILLILLFLIKSSQIYFGYRSIKKQNFALLCFHVDFETWDLCFKWIFFTSEKPNMGRNLGWNRASWLWYRVRRVSHWPPGRLTPPPGELRLSVTFHLFQSHASVFNTDTFYVDFVKWWPLIQAHQRPGCKSKNSTGDLGLPQEPFQCSGLTCPSLVAHQHAKAGSYPWHQSRSRYLSQHALPTKLSWKPW